MYARVKYYICIMVVRYYTFFYRVTLSGSGTNALKNNTITNKSILKITDIKILIHLSSSCGVQASGANGQVRFGRKGCFHTTGKEVI